ncbi:MAG TPA: glycosyltransferase family 39 protein [Myxococcota bacterium]|nr:glycosyltransferase family 39 protein [Myxococcota bacterium]
MSGGRARTQSAAAALALGIAAFAAGAWLVFEAERAPDVPFLSARAPAEWLIRAEPPVSVARPVRERTVAFRRSFALAATPHDARLRVRFFRAGSAELNGAPVPAATVAPGADWKELREADVAALLRPGDNELVLRANTSTGPPAVWAVLESEAGVIVASDSSWTALGDDGRQQRVRLATRPMSDWLARPPADALALLRATWIALAACAVIAGLGLDALRRVTARIDFRSAPAAPVAFAALALGLLWWNDRNLDLGYGFDSGAHLDYVRYILANHRLPFADEGWSMYHPPLYYAAASGVVALFGESAPALHALNALAAVVQCAAVWGALGLSFPERAKARLAGLALALFLPMQLYLAQYVTNELWSAALASCALWLALRIAVLDLRGARVHAALGALLGLGLLAKFSGLVPAVVALAVLAGRLVARSERAPRVWLATLGSALAALVAVAGWHYARVWWHFGSPLVGNWDALAGRPWWQDPGYRTAGDYLRFGESLTYPVFAACNGCLDGLYSTAWGDGLVGGMASPAYAPPWHWQLLRAGVWLALVPSAAVALGFAATLAKLVRAPGAAGWLVVGTALATGFALVSLSLRLPFYAQCKAFYGLGALVPLAAFGGLGLDLAAARLGRAAPALWLAFGTWALCAYATYWVS